MSGPVSVSHTKPAGSLAVLNMYAILPYHHTCLNPDLLILGMSWGRYGSKTIQQKKTIVAQLMFRCFKRAADELNKILVGKDDANVELIPLMDETHVHVYMRLPVMVAPHVILVKLRVLVHKYMKVCDLDFYSVKYKAVFKPFYFVTSFLPRNGRVRQGDERNLAALSKIFCYEAGLKYTGDLNPLKLQQWGQLDVPMSTYHSLFYEE